MAERNKSSRRAANDSSDTRHETRSGSGANEPKHSERKEERGWVSRQGGDQTRRQTSGDEAGHHAEDEA
jgi:hypothetical protein